MLTKPILLTAALALGFAPPVPAPPMKMGLWESTTITDMNGAMVPSFLAHRTTKAHVCITPESWAKVFTNNNKNCERKTEALDGNHYTSDLSCARMSSHVDVTFDTPESAHGTVQILSDGNNVMGHSTTDMKFIGADCGSITPEKPQIIK